MRCSRYTVTPFLTLLAGLVLSSSLHAQASEKMAPDFDPDRAMLNDKGMFDPFRPTTTEPLATALAEGRVSDDTALLVLERGGQHLALLTMQMTYHHVAQGELRGEPWMVSF